MLPVTVQQWLYHHWLGLAFMAPTILFLYLIATERMDNLDRALTRWVPGRAGRALLFWLFNAAVVLFIVGIALLVK